MNYIFNKVTILVVIGISVIMALSLNELSQFVDKTKVARQALMNRWLTTYQAVYKSQELCQISSGALCDFKECDVLPSDPGYAEQCGNTFKEGWVATNVPIPEFYKRVDSVSLMIKTPTSTGTLVASLSAQTIGYASTNLPAPTSTLPLPRITTNDGTRLVNAIVLYDAAQRTAANTLDIPGQQTKFTLTVKPLPVPTASTTSPITAKTFSCQRRSCSNDFMDIVRMMVRYWGGPLVEWTE